MDVLSPGFQICLPEGSWVPSRRSWLLCLSRTFLHIPGHHFPPRAKGESLFAVFQIYRQPSELNGYPVFDQPEELTAEQPLFNAVLSLWLRAWCVTLWVKPLCLWSESHRFRSHGCHDGFNIGPLRKILNSSCSRNRLTPLPQLFVTLQNMI